MPEDPPGRDGPSPVPTVTQALNLIRATLPDPKNLPMVAVCPYCQADLGAVCFGRYVDTADGVVLETWHPIRCPECHHPLLYIQPPSPIIRARPPV